ncbi:MAG: PD40 domain-containing protein [Xanthomonadales bacterium]|nr:hypothetical protein [Xanthomonadales bacterium]MCC6592536.1 PD40 domain-containing protein [Xanthomonadales bacterium]MCE7930954.1 hypothetical protein [Xanthomonadales bacterium PRO6]
MNRFLIGALALLCGCAAQARNAPENYGPAPRATGASLSNIVSVEDACGGVRYSARLSFTGTHDDGGGIDIVWFLIFDDFEEKFAQAFGAPIGQTAIFNVSAEYPGRVGTVVPGIGVYVSETRTSGPILLQEDPFLPTPTGGCTIGGAGPALTYNPTTGSTIAYNGSGVATPITVGNAGTVTGNAVTTLTNCAISGGGAFPTTAFNPNITASGISAPSPNTINLPACVPQSSAQNATLSCLETRGQGATPLTRTWTLSCPVAVVSVPPPVLGSPVVEATAVGGGLPNGNSQAPVLNRNGTRIAYTSDASNIVDGDTNGRDDIFLRDRALATTTRISALAAPLNPGVTEGYVDPQISADGNTVAFAGTSGQAYAVANGAGRRISANAAGTFGNGTSANPFPTSNGALVFFDSTATNLLSGSDGNGATGDIFVKSLGNESVTLISRDPNGGPADGPSAAPHASADGQVIVFHTLAENIVPSGGTTPTAFSQNFDGVTPPALPSGWNASSPTSGNGVRWQTSSNITPAAHSAPNAVIVDEETVTSNKLLDSPPLTITAQPATLSFQRVQALETGFDGLVLEISVSGGGFVDAVAAGGSFSSNGYNGTISSQFGSPIAGRNAWTGNTSGYVQTVYRLPGNLANGTQVRFRWRLATDNSVGGGGVFLDSFTSTNLGLASEAEKIVRPAGYKAGTIQQATMMRGGGFGQTRFYLSRNRSTGELGNGNSINVKVTPDGRWAVFESVASNLISGDSNGVSDIYRVEVVNDQVVRLERVSVGRNGEQANGASRNAQISDDGQLVTFDSEATNLVAPDTNNAPDVMLKSMLSGDILRQNAAGTQPNGLTVLPTISGDGSTLGFCTLATNVAGGDNNGAADVFSTAIGNSLPRDEPTLVRFPLPAPTPANPNCPAGFFIAAVDDGPGAGVTSGAFGVEALLDDPGTRVLQGGLNFGGLIDSGQPGFAGFNFTNAANEMQRINISLTGSPASSSTGSLPVRVTIIRQTTAGNQTVFDNSPSITLAAPFTASVDLTPGFYVATVSPVSGTVGGAPEGQFFFSLTTSFIGRPGGGFQGGAVVGGYHATHPFGGVSGFAAYCISTAHSNTIRVLSQPTYGPTGAKDLRLRVLDGQQATLVTVPGN